MIDGAPKVVLDAVDLHEDFIQMPLPLSMLSHVGRTFRSDLSREDRPKAIDPEPYTLMADIDAPFVK